MTQAAMVIHKELVEEGIVPSSSPDEYYNELDSRIRGEFPERFKNTAAKKVPPVLSGTRSAIGKNQVKLSKSEVDMANRLEFPYKNMRDKKCANRREVRNDTSNKKQP